MAIPPEMTRRHRLPPFDDLVKNYPTVDSVIALKKMIGGGADDTGEPPGPRQWLGGANGDTCTLRMSRALNYSGVHLPSHQRGLRTVHGQDKFNYAFAVHEFEQWLLSQFGSPDINVKGAPVSRQKFAGHKGIIVFDINFGLNMDGQTRALGHADLWDGKTFYDELNGTSNPNRDFFNIALQVSLWITDGAAMLSLS